MISPSLKIELTTMPAKPGVYQFLNKDNAIIYIGKAKNLKKRVSSYFRKTITSRKTKNLVKNIYEIKHVIVSTESDALLLENSLIKKYQPKYNILLRDGKLIHGFVLKKNDFQEFYLLEQLLKMDRNIMGLIQTIKRLIFY